MRDQTRQALALLHSLAGLAAGVLLILVFWTGTLLVFDKEIDRWMLPETRLTAGAREAPLDHLLELNRARLVDANGNFQIRRPTPREPYFQIRFVDRRTGQLIVQISDPQTGRPLLTTTDRSATGLVFALHYRLNIGSSDVGYWIVGLVAITLLVLVVSGIAIHRKLIDEFFVYRAGKQARRRLLDLHNLTSLVALPFNVIMPLTGLYIVFALLLPVPFTVAARGDPARLDHEIYGGSAPVLTGRPVAGVSIDALLRRAEAAWQQREGTTARADRLDIAGLGDRGGTLVVAEAYPSDAVTIGRRSMTFELATGQRVDDFEAPPVVAAHGWLTGLHFAQFDNDVLRWLYFGAGLCGTGMIVTGLLFWLEARRRADGSASGVGYRVAEALTIAGTTGLVAATAALLFANRLADAALGADPRLAVDLEAGAFFGTWALALAHAAGRRGRAWSDQLLGIAGLAAAAVALNGVTTGDFLWTAAGRGRWPVLGVDLVLLAAALVALLLGLQQRRPSARGRAPADTRRQHP